MMVRTFSAGRLRMRVISCLILSYMLIQLAVPAYAESGTISLQQLMKQAERQARYWNHEYIGTEHILLVIAQVNGAAHDILYKDGIDEYNLYTETLKLINKGESRVNKKNLYVMPAVNEVINFAIQHSHDAKELNTGQILLGIVYAQNSLGAQVLANLGMSKDDVLQKLMNYENGTSGGEAMYAAANESENTPSVKITNDADVNEPNFPANKNAQKDDVNETTTKMLSLIEDVVNQSIDLERLKVGKAPAEQIEKAQANLNQKKAELRELGSKVRGNMELYGRAVAVQILDKLIDLSNKYKGLSRDVLEQFKQAIKIAVGTDGNSVPKQK